MTEYSINDLPKYSPWPRRLLGLDPWEPHKKNAETLTREYEIEKWGPLLERVRNAGRQITVEEVDEWIYGIEPCLTSIEDRIELMNPTMAHKQFLDLVEKVLTPFLPVPAILELGAGYGSVILGLAKRPAFASIPLLAGEYAPSGVELIRHLGRTQKVEVQADLADFTNMQQFNLSIPPGALIFTAFAVPCVPNLPEDFIHSLISYRPSAVVHIEPVYGHSDPNLLLGLMRRRYIEMNDYNRNLDTLLHSFDTAGVIDILNEYPSAFGKNPLLSASIFAWEPRRI